MDWHSLLDDLRRHVLASLGVAPPLLLAACSGAPDQQETHGVTTDPSGDGTSLDDGADGTSSGGSSSTTASTTASTSGPTTDPGTSSTGPEDDDEGDGDGDEIKLDLPPEPDLPPPTDCMVTAVPTSTLDEHPDCPIVPDEFCSDLFWGCVELGPGQTCQRLCPDGDCVIDWWSCDGDPVFDVPGNVCGPYEVDGQCCSLADVYNFCGTDGRPFVVAGTTRQADLRARGGGRLGACELPERVREQLIDHWTAVARAEHASIASFAQFGARLLAIGAPPSLVRDALAAAGDEVRHAELALARASELTGVALEFGPLDVGEAGRASLTESFADTVLACVREGCIGETLAALELGAAALACDDVELAASLRAIADDEARHAALAWSLVRWALDRAPGLAPAVAAVFESLVVAEPAPERFDASERALLRAHGCLPSSERHRVRQAGVRALLGPCAAALLGPPRPPGCDRMVATSEAS
ncbi:MAG TPA: ferritin-like domain-containing protein [Enhygromyxa sp.]|nr:ferritin-like domain-containing protein [Enhygromyxa sp.]